MKGEVTNYSYLGHVRQNHIQTSSSIQEQANLSDECHSI